MTDTPLKEHIQAADDAYTTPRHWPLVWRYLWDRHRMLVPDKPGGHRPAASWVAGVAAFLLRPVLERWWFERERAMTRANEKDRQ